MEAESGRLKDDIEGHVNVAGFILAERDQLRTALEKREAELLELSQELQREQDQSAAASQAHESALTELRTAFDQDRLALMAAADVSAKEVDQQRRVFERERAEIVAELKRREDEAAELRLAFEREREALQSRFKSREEELLHHAPIPKVNPQPFANRSRRSRSSGPSCGRASSGSASCASSPNAGRSIRLPVLSSDANSPADGASAVVPKETLRQARAQFEFLAKECLRRGDVATQAMCELGAHAMQLALAGDESADASPIGRMALNILSLSDPDTPVRGKSGRSAG